MEHNGNDTDRRIRRSFDWQHAAELIAAGEPWERVAAGIGCSYGALLRAHRRSARFRRLLAEARARRETAVQRRLETVLLNSPQLIEAAVARGDGAVLRWALEWLLPRTGSGRSRASNAPQQRTAKCSDEQQ